MIRILVAMEREAKSLGLPCDVIGINGTNLPETTEEDILVNVGYCGGYQVPVGAVIEPYEVIDSKTGECVPLEAHFHIRACSCITADQFVTEPLVEKPAVYDMELWEIQKLPHKKLYCLKIVSDNLDEADCDAFDDKKAWETVRQLLAWERLNVSDRLKE